MEYSQEYEFLAGHSDISPTDSIFCPFSYTYYILQSITMRLTTNILHRPLTGLVRAQTQIPLTHAIILRASRSRHTNLLNVSRTFSTTNPFFNKLPRRPQSGPKEAESDAVEVPSMSLAALGIGRSMKLFLIACLCVLGTMETWFWYKAFWVWWEGKGEEESADSE